MSSGNTRIAAFGGAYANPFALEAVLEDARERGCERIFNLGDLGGFGADINSLWPLLERYGVESIAGNYDLSLGYGEDNCGCGYTDPREREEAQRIYDYTSSAVDPAFAEWMRTLATQRRLEVGGVDVLLVHGSPIEVNDFLWESLSDDELRTRLDAVPQGRPEVMLCTHTGIPWQRKIDGTLIVNVGAAGKPPNDGTTQVTYAALDLAGPGAVSAEIRHVGYDWRAQAASISESDLPATCAETIETGWWPSVEVIPPAERNPAARKS